MTVRRKLVGRSDDGRRIYAIAGDELPWKYDRKEDVFFVMSKDGRYKYIVARSRPTGTDSKGHKLYPYWMARAIKDNDMTSMTNLGDEHMNAYEGKEVCQIWESSRDETDAIPTIRRRQLPVRR